METKIKETSEPTTASKLFIGEFFILLNETSVWCYLGNGLSIAPLTGEKKKFDLEIKIKKIKNVTFKF